MNTQEPRRTVRNTRQRKITLDLNVPPPTENREQERTSARPGAQGGSSAEPRGLLPPPIDLEAIDDEVIISSPRAFEQAKNNSRRTRGRTLVVDVESGLSSRVSANNCVKRRRAPSNRTINDIHIYLDGSSSVLNEDVGRVAIPPLPPPPKEPSFSCPVCMGPLVEEMSTKCGHIFCKACIKASIAAQSKCPTCRRKIAMKDIIRIYLPTTS